MDPKYEKMNKCATKFRYLGDMPNTSDSDNHELSGKVCAKCEILWKKRLAREVEAREQQTKEWKRWDQDIGIRS